LLRSLFFAVLSKLTWTRIRPNKQQDRASRKCSLKQWLSDEIASSCACCKHAGRSVQHDTPHKDHTYYPTEPPSYGSGPDTPYYPSEGPSYYNPRADAPDSYPRGHGWPQCWGTCSAGKCQLDVLRQGCCHLGSSQQGSYGGRGYASAAAADVDGGDSADRDVAPDDGNPSAQLAEGEDSSSSTPAEALYGRDVDGDLVCWRDGEVV
jgi:hypothetical protein